MTCPRCNGPLPPAEAAAYRGRCENCFVANAPPARLRETAEMLNQALEPGRYVSTQQFWDSAGFRGERVYRKPMTD